MKTITLNILDHLSADSIREIMQEELRLCVRNHFRNEQEAERLLSNLAYGIIRDEIEKIVPDYHDTMVKKVAGAITKDVSGHIYNYAWDTGAPRSYGAKLIDQTVKENQQLIKDKVVETIRNKDYSEDAWAKFENLAESFTSNIYDLMETLRGAK